MVTVRQPKSAHGFTSDGPSGIDRVYTPIALAERLASVCRLRRVSVIADFTAGGGALLSAAVKRWPRSRVFAGDIDPTSVRRLRSQHPNWNISRCDFLSPRSRSSARGLAGLLRNVDLVLLNPPFSCRGSTRDRVTFGNIEFTTSRAGAFLVHTLPYLRRGGEVLAILPSSFWTSEKDRSLRAMLRSLGRLELLGHLNQYIFSRRRARAVIVRLKLGQRTPAGGRTVDAFGPRPSPRINIRRLVRGVTPIYRLVGSGDPVRFIHSTDLCDGVVAPRIERVKLPRRHCVGPAVLLPRVGEPSARKLALFTGERVVLSDCVFGIECASRADSEALLGRMQEAWAYIASAYVGTGARYTTRERLTDTLRTIGVLLGPPPGELDAHESNPILLQPRARRA